MSIERDDDRYSSVTLGVNGRNYAAELWGDSVVGWTLQEVRLESGPSRPVAAPPFASLEGALRHAEVIAVDLIAEGRLG
ncbi:hypothetical protein HH110_04415 [Stenotrophomonas sp. SAM-B]|uniref:hypothetical protein n=1 Tax=Stenotrophomonas sp. SAM-B TaxID=2729141 RepID=UPI0015A3526A|nr:hypothetical protein [Stenotrophomonas sp. SAM-B]NWF32291.1 hypothetical protein [Stenotrophomonas sp. SAM-B]